MSAVAVIAKLTAAAGKGDELAAVIGDLVSAVQADEPDTAVYAASRDAENADIFWFYELYGSAEAAAAHSGGDALKSAGARMGGLLGAAPEIHRLRPVAAKGLPL